MNSSFNSLNNTFNMTGADVEDIDDDINDTNFDSSDDTANQKYKLKNHNYLLVELQDQIERLRSVAEEMRQCCKVGAPPRMFEVYAGVEEKISNNLMKIKELEQTETDYQVTETKEQMIAKQMELKQQNALRKLEKAAGNNQTLVQNNIQNTYNMTSSELLQHTLDAMNGNNSTAITKEEDLPVFNLD